MLEQHKEKASSEVVNHKQLANAIRALAMDAVQKANSGHPGMPMGMADVATVLFSQFLKFNPKQPNWLDRDRFILSAGHGSMLLYALLYLTGYEDITIDDIKQFRQLGAKTAGHPEYGHAAGIETTTGPLGQGLANSVGFALAERMLAARYSDAIIDHYTYVIAGDGCLMEGISQEAISLAGHLQLNKLIVLFDDNGISIDGPTSLSTSEDHKKRFEACGWYVQYIDGHDPKAIADAISNAKESDRPSMIACKTIIAYGAPNKAGTSDAHGSALGDTEIKGAREKLGWPYAAFEIPVSLLNSWRNIGLKCENEYKSWQKRFDGLEPAKKHELNRVMAGNLPTSLNETLAKLKQKYIDEKPNWATRKASQEVLKELVKEIPELIGGSADLTGSNNTKTDILHPITKDNYAGRYIYYGIREHGMAAAMNGIALHGGFIPYGGTFLAFTDYCRPSIRLSALMGIRVIYVMTHDSIGLGEDGPTHQPVEHLAALRSIPNLNVLRPADAVETLECWQLAVEAKYTPSVLALTRQNIPTCRTIAGDNNLCSKGAYVIRPETGKLEVTIMASGSEVEIAIKAGKMLEEKNIGVRIVSVPCFNLFDQQNDKYKLEVIGKPKVKVAVEAALAFGWHKYIGHDGVFVGMPGFGASAPADALYKHFGITADNIITQVMNKMGE